MSRDPFLFLEDIQQSCAKINSYVEGLTLDEFLKDPMRFDAVLLNLQVIGEAVKNLPEVLRKQHPEVAWREIAGLRDFVAHAYFALDLDILWDAIQKDVPSLLADVTRIVAGRGRG